MAEKDATGSKASIIEPIEDQIKALRTKRAVHKRKITNYIKKLKNLHASKTLKSSLCKLQIKEINSELEKVNKVNEEINELMLEVDYGEINADKYNEELDNQSDYTVNVNLELDEFESYLLSNPTSPDESINKLTSVMSSLVQSEGKPPPLNCGKFSGREKDKFAFHNFLTQFENIIGSRKNFSDSVKLTYLFSYLEDYAFKLVEHLTVSDSNYKVAIDLLKDEFLDGPYIVDETYKNLLEAAPGEAVDREYTNIKLYISEIRSYLHELKTYGEDFLEEDTPGNSLVSHIIVSRLPRVFKIELFRIVGSNYPTLSDVFSHYNDIIKTLSITNSGVRKRDYKPNKGKFTNSKPKSNSKSNENVSTIQNFNTESTKTEITKSEKPWQNKTCKLCSSVGHSLGQCKNFPTYEAKTARLLDLSLCTRCAGSGHSESECYGAKGMLRHACMSCQSKNHITPLCPVKDAKPKNVKGKTSTHLCFAQRNIDGSNILPTITLILKNGKKTRRVRCLVDTGSQRSYISKLAAEDLCSSYDNLAGLEQEVHTYIGEETKSFKQMSTGVRIGNRLIFVPLLVDETLDISFEMHGMSQVVRNLRRNKILLADNTFYEHGDLEKIKVDMLLGIDILQHFTVTNSNCLGGSCLVINGKVAPVGNVFNFLNSKQSKILFDSLSAGVTKGTDEKTKSSINLIMDPLKSYFNPLEHILTDSEVDNGLENLFSLESMGISHKDNELVAFDKDQVDNFKKGISFRDGHYHVSLPWYSDKVSKVPSNHQVALKVLDRTVNILEKKGIVDKYEEVYDKQLEDEIIEEIKVEPSCYNQYTWIPHRPVIKMEEQVTTKIRPVFNCSLKTSKNLPSLNEAAYPGVDLMTSILKLLFYFRTNNFVMLSDIKQAFLMVKLANEYDKNRFCFFWKRNNELVTYRYKSIVFGYTSSPFILNYVIKHHAETFPDDKCKQILSNNFYVDNLVITGNGLDEMKELYETSFDRMNSGGFFLRSWNSNSTELREKFKEDGRIVEHECSQEKVLGYRYNVNNDSLSLAPCNINVKADTKRQVLSQVNKVFDPLNFSLPVSIRGKILMRKIWKLGLGWDDKVPLEINNEMKNLGRDLEMLSVLEFPRQAVNEQNEYGLHIFCDSSTEAYGFVAYACSEENEKTFLFAKSKLAPMNKGKELSVPTLELMGVVLSLKCLPTILEAYKSIKFQFVNICVDAQVVLNWLLTGEPKVKSKFVRNRVLEVNQLISEIKSDYNFPVIFRYVNTEQNPADLITRGLSYKKYLSNKQFWLQGPEWLTNDFTQWPDAPLLSVSPDYKHKVSVHFTARVPKVNTGIFNINNFSSYEKLLRCTAYVFKLVSKVKGGDPKVKALNYWIKVAQSEHFYKEIDFLKNVNNESNKTVPPLVSNLNLFLDDNGIIRSRGRIAKCLYFNYDVHNPVLLPNGHRFTALYISYCHAKVQHLGIGTTLNFLREQGFWIPRGRMAVKTVLSNCIICKKYNALAFKYPRFVDMPKHHMNLVKPFEHVGVDYTGHFWVKNANGQSSKMFILIFTCLNIRAVHFELLPDMTTQNFLLAFQRFCNMYSIPQYLYSDNAKTFLKGGCILQESLQSKEFKSELERCNIKHIKIPLYSAWVGAAWERLIRVLKSCLYKVVGRAKLSYFELLTTLSNIKLAINSRPLTYRASTSNLEFITPNSFLKLHGNSSLILRGEDENVWVEDVDQKTLTRTLELQEEVFDNFKTLWYESYLLSLRERSRNLYQNKWEDKIKVGDIVLIKSPIKPRPFWMMGRVLELVIGFDNKVRSVKLKQGNGNIEYHSISHLYPLEISFNPNAEVCSPESNNEVSSQATDIDSTESIEDETSQGQGQGQSGVESQISVRPKRKATERFHKMMRDNLEDL